MDPASCFGAGVGSPGESNVTTNFGDRWVPTDRTLLASSSTPSAVVVVSGLRLGRRVRGCGCEKGRCGEEVVQD